MQWGIVFKVPASFESDLWGLPPPSYQRWLSSMDGKEMIQVFYHFQYTPQSWKEWQRVASIKIIIEHRLGEVIFDEYELPNIINNIYTISELGKYFKAFIKFPKPQFPQEAGEQYKMLCRHAKRLHYEGLLNIEQLIATSLRFNDAMITIDNISRRGYQGPRQVIRLAKASYLFALDNCDDWKVKLSPEMRHQVLKTSALKTAEIKRIKSKDKRNLVSELRDKGLTLKAIASIVGISLRTVSRYLKEDQAPTAKANGI